MGSTISDSCYNTIIMSSLPESYRPTLQTITAAEWASTLLGTSSSRAMKPDDLITFITEEAQHCVINDERTKNAESALAAFGKKHREASQQQGQREIHTWRDMRELQKRRPHQGRLLGERRRQRRSRAKGTKLQERREEGRNSSSSRSDRQC